jgi:hypothetical protein
MSSPSWPGAPSWGDVAAGDPLVVSRAAPVWLELVYIPGEGGVNGRFKPVAAYEPTTPLLPDFEALRRKVRDG